MSNEQAIRRLNRWADDVAKQLNLAVEIVMQKLALDAWSKLTKKTPVDTGRARASWIISQTDPSGWVPSEGTHAMPGDPDVSDIDGKSTVFVTSSLVYMGRLEDGWSKQAPHGMIRITIAEINAEISVILSRL